MFGGKEDVPFGDAYEDPEAEFVYRFELDGACSGMGESAVISQRTRGGNVMSMRPRARAAAGTMNGVSDRTVELNQGHFAGFSFHFLCV